MKKLFLILVVIISELSAESLRIEPEELFQNKDNFVIIDVRSESDYKKGHLIGARSLPILKTYEYKKRNGKLLNPTKMQTLLQNLGLRENSKIVIYDKGDFLNASRLFWALEVYGFKSIKLLNIDFYNWANKNQDKISTLTPQVQKSDYIITMDSTKLATKFSTQIATKNSNYIILDAREQERYLVKKSKAQRFGHIPTALNVPATFNIKKESGISKLKSKQELKELYSNINKNKKIITYCTHGKRSAANYFALRELGYNVSSYDSSWQEWANDFSLPIKNPSKK